MQHSDRVTKARICPTFIPPEMYTCQLKTCTLYTMFQTLFSLASAHSMRVSKLFEARKNDTLKLVDTAVFCYKSLALHDLQFN